MSSAAQNPRSVAAGTYFGKYELLDCIAESLMSKVFLARLNLGKLNRIVVVKTLHPSYLQNKDSREQFYREIEMTMALAHPNIIQIHEFGEEAGCPFIVMEWVHGRDLKDVVKTKLASSGRGISPLLASYLIEQAARGLEYAHDFKDKLTGQSYNLVHRDLSPHNLILGFNGMVKLIDFGVARVAHGQSESLSDQIWGKAGYFSPEQANGQRLDRRSDIFALGAVLFELLSGRRLFEGKDLMASMGRIFQADTHVPERLGRLKGLPQPLADIIIKSTRAKREERYESAAKFAEDIRKFMRSQPGSVDTETVVRFMGKVFPGDAERDEARLRELSAGLGPSQPISAPNDFRPKAVEKESASAELSEPVPTTEQETELDAHETPLAAPVSAPPPTPLPPTPPTTIPPTVESFIPKNLNFDDEPQRLRYVRKNEESGRETEKPKRKKSSDPDTGNSLRLDGLRKGLFLVKLFAVAVGGFFIYYFYNGFPTGKVLPLPQPPRPPAPLELMVHLHTTPELNSNTTVLLDGRPVQVVDGVLPSMRGGGSHHLEIRRPGFQRAFSDVGSTDSIDVELIPLDTGTLSLSTAPTATGRITNGTDLWVKYGPLQIYNLPPGQYRVYLSTTAGRERKVLVTVRKNQVATMQVDL